MEIRLYNVDSTVEEYHGCKNVNFRWFVYERQTPPVPYAAAIEGYRREEAFSPHWQYAELAIEELFTTAIRALSPRFAAP